MKTDKMKIIMFKEKRETLILISIFLLALILRISFLFSTPIRIWDEAVYVNLGYDLSHNPFDYSLRKAGWSDFIPSGGDEFYSWPKIGFRAPLLPYLLALFFACHLETLIPFIIPFVGSLSVILVYILGKKIFDSPTGIIASLLFCFMPLHVILSANILTGVLVTFFILLTFINFIKGFEENNKIAKILFGVFLALSLLTRYTTLWIIPVFLFYLLIRDKNLKWLTDIYLWLSIITFFIILSPWLIYGIGEYQNPFGALFHGFNASYYWGGKQPWDFYFNYWGEVFSLIGLIFPVGIIYLASEKKIFQKKIYLLLIWTFNFLLWAIYIPHKEMRNLLLITPPICLLSAVFIRKSFQEAPKNFLALSITIIICSINLTQQFINIYQKSYTDTNLCYLEGIEYLKTTPQNSLIITDESAGVYFHTHRETSFYPDPWSVENLQNRVALYENKTHSVYILFTSFNLPLESDQFQKIHKDLEANYPRISQCSYPEGYTAVYQIQGE